MSMLQIKNLKVEVGDKRILTGLNMEVSAGEVVIILGPNGSGKSTLAYTLMAHPNYKIVTGHSSLATRKTGSIKFDGKYIDKLGPDERAKLGIFLAMQSPVAIPGLSMHSLLWRIYKNRSLVTSHLSLLEFRNWIEKEAEKLGLDKEILKRGMNDGFSGGERKKMEILQMLVANPKLVILDEIDSGLDVDALKKIAQTVAAVAKQKRIGVIVITHYSRILKYINADRVLVMKEGRIVEEGGREVIDRVEKNGYEN